MTAGYDTLIVTFSDPIKVLDNMFSDADAWGTDTLKGWVEDYESTRFTQINPNRSLENLAFTLLEIRCNYGNN